MGFLGNGVFEMRFFNDLKNNGHVQWPWPMAMANGHGQWPWPLTMTMAMTNGHGQWPWPWSMAMADIDDTRGHSLTPVDTRCRPLPPNPCASILDIKAMCQASL